MNSCARPCASFNFCRTTANGSIGFRVEPWIELVIVTIYIPFIQCFAVDFYFQTLFISLHPTILWHIHISWLKTIIEHWSVSKLTTYIKLCIWYCPMCFKQMNYWYRFAILLNDWPKLKWILKTLTLYWIIKYEVWVSFLHFVIGLIFSAIRVYTA